MSLQDELDALRAEFVRSAPPGRAALYDARVDELRRRDRSDSSQTTQGVAIRCGTGSSNPALSTGESPANREPPRAPGKKSRRFYGRRLPVWEETRAPEAAHLQPVSGAKLTLPHPG